MNGDLLMSDQEDAVYISRRGVMFRVEKSFNFTDDELELILKRVFCLIQLWAFDGLELQELILQNVACPDKFDVRVRFTYYDDFSIEMPNAILCGTSGRKVFVDINKVNAS